MEFKREGRETGLPIIIGLDVFYLDGAVYLISVCYLSFFIEFDILPKATTRNIIACLNRHFARFGRPKTVVSDMGSQFSSDRFEKFIKLHNITHHFSDPYRQRMNGKAEAGVKQMKLLLKKSKASNTNPFMALLEYNNTPRQNNGLSPAQMMFGRPTRALLPQLCKPSQNFRHNEISDHNAKVKSQYDKHAHKLSPLFVGQKVFFQNPGKKGWNKGVITDIVGSRSYHVECICSGAVYRRNRVHIRPDNSVLNTSPVYDNNDGDFNDYLVNNENQMNKNSSCINEFSNSNIDIHNYDSYLYDNCFDTDDNVLLSHEFVNSNVPSILESVESSAEPIVSMESNDSSDDSTVASSTDRSLNPLDNVEPDSSSDIEITDSLNAPTRSSRSRRAPGWLNDYTLNSP